MLIKNEKLNKQQLKDFYSTDYVSKFCLEEQKQKRRLKRLLKFINLKKNDIVFDAGCGNGLLLDFISDRINFYYGVDFSEDFIKVARDRQSKNKISNAKFVREDISVFCKGFKNYFDKIFALDFVEHIYDGDFIKIFTLLYSSLKIGGEIYIHTPNGKYFIEILKQKNILKQLPEHIAVRTAREYRELLKKVGFQNIKIIYLPHYLKILSIFDFLKYIPFFGKYFKARLFFICQK
jgi:cyclopropane fatty-acyl-phospholipid synthase-like methyltransferase